MANSTHKIYLVAGATRGLGLALVAEIAATDPSAIIYAGGRNPPGATLLVELAARYPGRVVPVKYIAADKEGNEALAKEISAKHGRVDTVIANAATGSDLAQIHETTIETYKEHFSVNTIGPIVLFQAFRDLLKASPLPRFIPISSGAGSIAMIESTPVETSAYSMSKAALNWVTRKIHYENEWLVAYPQCPGAVDTDMFKGFIATEKTGTMKVVFEKYPQRQPDEAARMLVTAITTSTREGDGGQFHNVEGGRHPW
ncbi:NAD(P)-binding protein [Pholiota conissans]|uniref:NAD(P)-binding protein n=1 Tax=Pholiota conissans TaxID=109636 RepID=A0A9P5ZAG4_9AGAR|nr:NAD(P)-binding protein [Pholiota conissans]